jgi:hypothetical protein
MKPLDFARGKRAMAIACVACFALSCSESPTAPTTTTETTPTMNTLQFSGTLSPGSSRFYSFTASRTGVATATLASVTTPPRNAAANVPVGVGIGRPAGTGCPTATSLTTDAALTTQLQYGVEQGIYCVNVYDPGTLAASVNFVVRFSFP